MDFFLNYSMYFIIYGFLGWIVEVVYTGMLSKRFVNRGFLFSPFLPIYSFGAIFIVGLLSNLSNHIILLFVIATIVTTVLEYVAGFFLENFFHVKWWDYSDHKYHIKGRVCLRNSLFFGFLSTFVVLVIQPPISEFVVSLNSDLKAIVVDVSFTCLIVDLFYTLRKLNRISVRSMDNVSAQTKNKEAQLPELFHGKYTDDRISNVGINILLTVSIIIGIIAMFIINIYFGIVITLIMFIILYATFKRTFINKKDKHKANKK